MSSRLRTTSFLSMNPFPFQLCVAGLVTSLQAQRCGCRKAHGKSPLASTRSRETACDCLFAVSFRTASRKREHSCAYSVLPNLCFELQVQGKHNGEAKQ